MFLDDVIGYEDLDDNGSWRNVPEYGKQPLVPAYHDCGDGRCITTATGLTFSPWGYTWVDDARLGALRHFTTDAGSALQRRVGMGAVCAACAPVRAVSDRYMRRHWWHGW